MPETLSSVDLVLWRIAELGAQCGQRSGAVDRRPMWEELERLIAEVGAELASARRDGDKPREKAQAAQRLDRAWRARLRKEEAARADVEAKLAASLTGGEAVVRLLSARANGERVGPADGPTV